MLRLLWVTMLIPSGFAIAEMPPLKRDNFELVAVGQYVGKECPFTKEDVEDVWKGELLRARLKEKEDRWFDQGVLWLSVTCLTISKDKKWAFDLGVSWTWADPFGNFPLIELTSNLGVGDKSFAQDAVKKTIEKGLTEYLRVNLE